MSVHTPLHSLPAQLHHNSFKIFTDGVNKFRVSKATGEPLPNSRLISNRISYVLEQGLNGKKPEDDLVNTNFVFFAQLVDHDFANTFPKPIETSTPVFGKF